MATLHIHPVFLAGDSEVIQSDTEETSKGASKGASKGISKEVLRVLNLLHGEMSIRELMEEFHFSSRDKFLANYLTPAIVGGFIEMTQPNSPKSPTQKYRLTALGKEFQRQNS